MNEPRKYTSDRVKRLVIETGAVAVGIAEAEPVSEAEERLYIDWIAAGKHGDMDYLDRWHDVRRDPRLLLENPYKDTSDTNPDNLSADTVEPFARSIIMAAFRYPGSKEITGSEGPLRWARYALGRDYHEVIRVRLGRVAEAITAETGAVCRVTVDTAPLRERYWAVQAGLGIIGLNGQLIVPGAGSMVLLGGIITTLELGHDAPSAGACEQCMKCVKACPGRALDGKGGMDARRCMSYLTIECRDHDALDRPLDGFDTSTPRDHIRKTGRIYGCDICQEVCPMNEIGGMESCPDVPAAIVDELQPRPEILALTRDDIMTMTQEEFSRIFTHSAIKRAKLAGLRRNAR